MKTFFILVTTIVILFTAAPDKVEAQKKKPTNNKVQSKTIAESGFYIKLSRCMACAEPPNQKKPENAMTTFLNRGIPAFYGTEKYNRSYDKILSLKKLSGVLSSPPFSLFVGPFKTESEAQEVVDQIPSILRKQIAKDEKENSKQAKEGFAIKLSPEEKTGFYEVEIVKVESRPK